MSSFQAIQARKIFFTIFQNVKTSFQPIKTRSSKSRKIEIFSKRLTHGFNKKNGLFSMSFFYVIQARKMCFTKFQNEKTHFQPIKKRSSKSRKIEIFPKALTHGFGQKTAIFSSLSFFCTIGQENEIYNIPEQKNACLAYKNNTFKQWKN